MTTGGDENIHRKVANCFYLAVPKLDNLKNRRGEESEIIVCSPLKRLLPQEQEKATKTNKNQINLK